MDEAARLREMLDKQACTEVIYRFARGLDRRDEALLSSLFHPDGTDDHGYFKGTGSEFVAWVLPLLAGMERTQHFIGNVLVEITGDEARSECSFIASHDLTAADGTLQRMTAAGRYLDTFRRHGGLWKLLHRRAVYDWNAVEPRTDAWDRSSGSARDFGKPGCEDSVYAHFAAGST